MEIINRLLLEAVQGESDAEKRYEAYAFQAKEEGFPRVSALFSALSRAEAIHIANHKRALKKNGYDGRYPVGAEVNKITSTHDHIQEALEGEREEFTQMYPSFRKQIAQKHGSQFVAKVALLSIQWAMESEKNHHELLQVAASSVSKGCDVDKGDYYLCRVCGNLHFSESEPADLCPVCGHDLHFYSRVEV